MWFYIAAFGGRQANYLRSVSAEPTAAALAMFIRSGVLYEFANPRCKTLVEDQLSCG